MPTETAVPDTDSTPPQQINVKVAPDLYEEVRRVAEREERSIAQTVRYALRRYIDSVGTCPAG
jgi:hypothetical protein